LAAAITFGTASCDISIKTCFQLIYIIFCATIFPLLLFYRYIPIHEINEDLGKDISLALPAFHAITGCDTVSAFFGKGEKSAWQAWQSCPGLTAALQAMSAPDLSDCEQLYPVVQVFVTRMYSLETVESVNEARRYLFFNKAEPLIKCLLVLMLCTCTPYYNASIS
jgi:hypothetical protein